LVIYCSNTDIYERFNTTNKYIIILTTAVNNFKKDENQFYFYINGVYSTNNVTYPVL